MSVKEIEKLSNKMAELIHEMSVVISDKVRLIDENVADRYYSRDTVNAFMIYAEIYPYLVKKYEAIEEFLGLVRFFNERVWKVMAREKLKDELELKDEHG